MQAAVVFDPAAGALQQLLPQRRTEQLISHVEAEHTALPVEAAGGAHRLPQVPQLYGSEVSVTQVVPQRSCVPQSLTQAPDSQTSPAAHARPQLRQFLASLCRSTQVPLQFTRPAGQHTPLEHTPPQAFPHAPQ